MRTSTAYCTLFARNYLEKGLVLIETFKRHAPGRRLFVLCMDDETFEILDKMGIECLVRRREVDSRELLAACKDRDLGERCWTYTPFLINEILKFSYEKRVVYLDADTMFFSHVLPIEQELESERIAIVPHRFPKRLEATHLAAGKFNVNFVMFDRSCAATECLLEWQADCLNWCYRKPNKEGWLGDQKYWDKYAEKYPVHAIEHVGVGLGPWNCENHKLEGRPGYIPTVDGTPVIQYHYHEFQAIDWGTGKFFRTNYPVSREQADLIYLPYECELNEAHRRVTTESR